MVAFNRNYVEEYDELQECFDDLEESDSSQHLRDILYWSGLSLAVGIFIGYALCWFSK